MRITISYTKEQEDFLREIMERVKAFLPRFKVKKSTARGGYMRLYFTLRKEGESAKRGASV